MRNQLRRVRSGVVLSSQQVQQPKTRRLQPSAASVFEQLVQFAPGTNKRTCHWQRVAQRLSCFLTMKLVENWLALTTQQHSHRSCGACPPEGDRSARTKGPLSQGGKETDKPEPATQHYTYRPSLRRADLALYQPTSAHAMAIEPYLVVDQKQNRACCNFV